MPAADAANWWDDLANPGNKGNRFAGLSDAGSQPGKDPYETGGGVLGGYLGAAGGTLLGPVGTVGGGILGYKLGSYLGKQVETNPWLGQGAVDRFKNEAGLNAQDTGPFGLPGYATAAQPAAPVDVARQNAYLSDLTAQAHGQGPSLAAAQAMAAGEQNARSMQGALAGQRGMNPGLASYLAGQQMAAAGANTAQAAGQARLAEAQAARGMLGQALTEQQRMAQDQSQFGATQQNQFAMERNRQIAEQERQRRQANLDARNTFFKSAEDAGQKALGKGLEVAGGGTGGGAGG